MSEREIGGSRGSAAPGQAGRVESRIDVGAGGWIGLGELEDRRELCTEWLKLVVSMIQGVRQGLVLLREEEGEGFLPAAVWPEGAGDLDSLGRAAQKALQAGEAVLLTGEEGDGTGGPRVAQPLMTGGKAWGVLVLEVEPRPEQRLRGVMRGLQASAGWLKSLDPHKRSVTADAGDEGARLVLESIAVLAEKEGFLASALGLAIRLEKELGCERVSLGVMKKRRLTVHAVSTSPQFVHKTNLVRSIESAMEEACDQETTVQHPVPEDAPFTVSIAHRAHARAYGHRSILSVPFDRNGEIVGAITLERPEGHPFTEEEVLAVEAVAALAGPQLDLAKREERWLGAKILESAGGSLRSLMGPRKRATRLILGAAILSILFVAFKQTDYRVTSDAFLEPEEQLLLSAPIQGYVVEAPARAGDLVSEGDLLYRLDDTELRLEVARLDGEHAQARKRHLQAMASGVAASVRILAAQLEQLRAQRELAGEQLARARVFAPMDGVIVSGDLTQSIGSPIERGQVVYTIAPLGNYRVVLQVADADIDECLVGQLGVIVLTAMPDREFELRIVQVTPVSTSEEGMTYFRVEAEFLEGVPREVLRPGMEGVGKVSVGRRSILWTWTHGTVDWLRMLLWKWTP